MSGWRGTVVAARAATASSGQPAAGEAGDVVAVPEPGPGARPGGVAPRTPIATGVAVSAAAQLSARGLHLVLNVVSSLAVVRYLAPGEYGVYAVVLTVTTLVALAADFGLPKLAIREIGAAPDDPTAEDRLLGTIVVLRVVLAVAAVAVSQLVLLLLRQPAAAYPAAAVASLVGVGEAVLGALVVVFHVRLAQQHEAWIRTSAELLETAAILLLVASSAPLLWLFVPPAAGTALAAVAAWALARHRFGLRLHFDRRRARMLLAAALPIAPALLLAVLYRKADSIVLAALRPAADLGVYSAAAQPVEYAFLSTALLMNVIFPLMSAARGRGDTGRFAELYRRGTECLVLITLALPVLLLFIARPLAEQVLGPEYVRADVPLVLLATAMVLLVVNVWQSLVLLLGGHQRTTLRYSLAALGVSAVSSVLLISALGLVGAGMAAVVTALFVSTVSTLSVRRLMAVRLELGPLLRIAAAAGLCAGVLAALSATSLPWPALAALGLLAYAVASRLTGAHHSFGGLIS